MLKVLEILAYPIRYGGIDMFVWQLIRSVDKSIHMDCLTPLNCVNEDFRKDLSERGGNLFELNLKKNGNLNYAYRPIKSFLKEHHYDVVHIHASSIQELAAIAAAADRGSKDTKVIVHSHGTGSKFTFVMRVFRRIAGFSMSRHVDCFCACSKVAAEWKYIPKHQKQAHLINNGINTEQFMFDHERRKEIRERMNISDSEFVLGNVGRLSYEKNQGYLINIFEKFLQIKPDAKLVLVGDGPDRDALVKLVEQKGLNERIIFAGNTTDVAGYLMAMDVFVFPSVHEAFGFAAVEAQASGLPVVASDIIPKDVKMCESVKFLPIGDENISKWTDAIANACCEDRKKGVEAVRKAGYDLKNTAKQVEKLYLS